MSEQEIVVRIQKEILKVLRAREAAGLKTTEEQLKAEVERRLGVKF